MPILKTPRDVTGAVERAWTRTSSLSLGYGVPGLTFDSGALLAFARLPDRNGRPATWLWYRDGGGCWTTYRDGSDLHPDPSVGRRGARPAAPDASEGSVTAEIRIGWGGRGALSLSLPEHRIHWSLRLRATPRTRALTILGLVLPDAVRRAALASRLTGPLAERLLRAAESPPVVSVRSPEGRTYRIKPRRVWLVEASAAVVGGRELGALRPGTDGATREPAFLYGRTEVRQEGGGAEDPHTGTGTRQGA